MPVQRTRKQDLEKRLKILESQLYGGGSERLRKTQTTGAEQQASKSEMRTEQGSEQIYRNSGTTGIQSHSEFSEKVASKSDLIFLRQDLTKIALLSSIAVGIQLVLYLSHALERVKLF